MSNDEEKTQLVTNAKWAGQNLTPAEKKLWWRLVGGTTGMTFDKKVPFVNFYTIADFYCISANLVISIDTEFFRKFPRKAIDQQNAFMDRDFQHLWIKDTDILENPKKALQAALACLGLRLPTDYDARFQAQMESFQKNREKPKPKKEWKPKRIVTETPLEVMDREMMSWHEKKKSRQVWGDRRRRK